ncbi:predicted protein [Sclerotinia sclerotiorum 1980 UF-70]|uniref:Uncharacterized protein n=1 Tax=Sclerotinia sclerotiorum (strain ATCC 18683 / 1980 / Ss-1) TaxID=665079 RepID=A7E9U7_SCLS1|nr:predicted protein [Sclerotinia sclerotiorum 1980 UF-70]EDN97149.1 predicted protein [Sclerotinia sclerotiorum 1980 UF-70]
MPQRPLEPFSVEAENARLEMEAFYTRTGETIQNVYWWDFQLFLAQSLDKAARLEGRICGKGCNRYDSRGNDWNIKL